MLRLVRRIELASGENTWFEQDIGLTYSGIVRIGLIENGKLSIKGEAQLSQTENLLPCF